jgi:cysteine desulfurase
MQLSRYFDYHATTPVDPRVLEAMLPFFHERFGNPSSRNHPFGWEASKAVDAARAQVASVIGGRHADIVFTSGATESNNLAIKGTAHALRGRGRHVVTVVTEHPSVLDSCTALEQDGFAVTRLGVGSDGLVSPDEFDAAITTETTLASVMTANNEIGVIQPIADLAARCRQRGVTFHTDASQAVGKIPFDVEALGVDLVSFTAHKFYGPKGVGALWVRRRAVEPAPQMHGGGHERGLRSGTLNVPGIVGLGRACELCEEELESEGRRLAGLRDRLLEHLRARVPDLRVNGSLTSRLPQNLNVSFPGIDSESLAIAMDDVAVSSGAACSTSKTEPSRVLTAIGLDRELAFASLRFGLGRWTTAEDVDYASGKTAAVIARLRAVKQELGANPGPARGAAPASRRQYR